MVAPAPCFAISFFFRRRPGRGGTDLLRYGAAGLFLLLLAAWLIVAARTVHGSVRGRLFLPAGLPG